MKGILIVRTRKPMAAVSEAACAATNNRKGLVRTVMVMDVGVVCGLLLCSSACDEQLEAVGWLPAGSTRHTEIKRYIRWKQTAIKK